MKRLDCQSLGGPPRRPAVIDCIPKWRQREARTDSRIVEQTAHHVTDARMYNGDIVSDVQAVYFSQLRQSEASDELGNVFDDGNVKMWEK